MLFDWGATGPQSTTSQFKLDLIFFFRLFSFSFHFFSFLFTLLIQEMANLT